MGNQKLLGVAVALISAYLQLISNATQLHQTRAVPFYSVTMSLVALTASMRLPASKPFVKISVFFLIFGCASILSSSTLPSKTVRNWLPYLACIRPFFLILPDPFQRRILQFSKKVGDKARQSIPAPMRRLFAAIKRLATEVASPDASVPSASSPSQENLNLEGVSVSREEVIPDASAAAPLASSSSQANLNLEEGSVQGAIPETSVSSHSNPTSICEGF